MDKKTTYLSQTFTSTLKTSQDCNPAIEYIQCCNEDCEKRFNSGVAECGTGYSWRLLKCPHCGQLHAGKKANGYIPEDILKDKDIIILQDEPQELYLVPGKFNPNEYPKEKNRWCLNFFRNIAFITNDYWLEIVLAALIGFCGSLFLQLHFN